MNFAAHPGCHRVVAELKHASENKTYDGYSAQHPGDGDSGGETRCDKKQRTYNIKI